MALMNTLKDPFVGANLNTQLWTQFTGGSATFTYGNGATVNYPASSTSSTDGDLTSVATYDLTGSNAFMQVFSVPANATSADAALTMKIDASNFLRFVKEGSTLFAQKQVATVTATVNSATYNPVTHKWWQIRESGGTIFWDTSTDGETWTNFTTFVNVLTITSITVLIAGTCFQAETNPGTYSWRFFNTNDSTGPYNHFRVGDGMSRSEVAN
jgi:hypothetical protein